MTPHKHAALIKAWADDTSITLQCRTPRAGRLDTKWATIFPPEEPTWNEGLEYRIKPETIKYRQYLVRYDGGRLGINSVMDWEGYDPTTHYRFVKWLSDWQEVEV